MSTEATPANVGSMELGALPAPAGHLPTMRGRPQPVYTSDQVIAYAAEKVAAERERWRVPAEYAAHQLEKARIWGGMEWTYNQLHPMHYRSALERLRDVLRA